jgi:hypothetical protein
LRAAFCLGSGFRRGASQQLRVNRRDRHDHANAKHQWNDFAGHNVEVLVFRLSAVSLRLE